MAKIFKTLSLALALFTIHYSLFTHAALAVCPVCTAAVVAGLGLSRWLRVDDTVSGVWIGAVLLSSSLWFYNWLTAKYPRFKTIEFQIFTVVLAYGLVFLPLAWTEVIGHPFNRLWGIDKLLLGTALGSTAFWLGIWLDKKVRKIRGKQLFNYQKIVFPVALLLLLSLTLWLITKP